MESSTAAPEKADAGQTPEEPQEGEAPQDAPAAGGDGDAPADPKAPSLELVGRGKQLSLKVTGDAPDKATAKMVGGKIDIPAGEYQPGDVVEAVVRIQCRKVSIIDKVNGSTGERTEREREHQFKMLQIERVND